MFSLRSSERISEFAREDFSLVSQVYKEKEQPLHQGQLCTALAGSQRTTKIAEVDAQGLTLSVNDQKLGRWGPQLHNPLAVWSQADHVKLRSLDFLICKMGLKTCIAIRLVGGLKESALRFKNAVPTEDITLMTICSLGRQPLSKEQPHTTITPH